ncbi:coiled-coil domain-containing protein 17-like [Watersipora subatra]|uniref:coiled-coil domain-containing protein 17-like n=1 Tax=Watersipora subatra TaxID=2589382 RepID=UPI00355C4D78
MVFNSIEQLSKHRTKFCVGTAEHVYDPRYVPSKAVLAEERIQQLQALKEASARRNSDNLMKDKFLVSQSKPTAVPTEASHQLQKKVNKLSHKHERHVTDLKSHAANLLKARNSIERRIAELSQGFERGEKKKELLDDSYLSAIEDLRSQIKALRNSTQQSHLVQSQPVVQQPDSHSYIPDFPQRTEQPDVEFKFGGGSLVAEISALRQHYIHIGGRDSAVLSQLTGMLKDAEQIEMVSHIPTTVTRSPPQLGNTPTSEELLAIELENYRLQRELMRLQNSDGPTQLPFSDGVNARMHVERMLALEREMELTKHQALLDSMKNQRNTQEPVYPYYRRLENITTEGYKPTEGFVCFYDFVMGLPSAVRLCRLIVGLYDRAAELGEPSMMPTVYTEFTTGGTTAMLGARQPVPRCPPSTGMYIVVELQTSDSTPEELRTKAWLKHDVFNSKLALQTGAWKLVFHNLPIKLDSPTSQLSAQPPYGEATLYMRVVHQRDSPTQSEAAISAANYIDYQFPPITSRPSAAPVSTNDEAPYSWAL